jgi:hypothetical protein
MLIKVLGVDHMTANHLAFHHAQGLYRIRSNRPVRTEIVAAFGPIAVLMTHASHTPPTALLLTITRLAGPNKLST